MASCWVIDRSHALRSPLCTSVEAPSFRQGCRNPASKDGKLWDTTDALVSTDRKLWLGKSPESSTCITIWLPSMAYRGREGSRLPSLRTARAVFPHTALQLAASTSGRIVNDFPRVIPSFALPLQPANPPSYYVLRLVCIAPDSRVQYHRLTPFIDP